MMFDHGILDSGQESCMLMTRSRELYKALCSVIYKLQSVFLVRLVAAAHAAQHGVHIADKRVHACVKVRGFREAECGQDRGGIGVAVDAVCERQQKTRKRVVILRRKTKNRACERADWRTRVTEQ